MNFQLFKTANFDQAITLPRVGFFSDVLLSVVAPLYEANDPKHPELAQLSVALAYHFSRLDPNTRVFLSLRSKDPYEIFNKKLLSFKLSEIRGLASKVEGASLELTDENVVALVDLILHEAIFIAWMELCHSNPMIGLISGAEGLAPSELIKTASDEDDKGSGPGRLKSRNQARIRSFRAPLLSQGRAELAALAYESLYNALIATDVLSVTKGHSFATTDAFRRSSLSMLIHHVDMVDMLDNFSSSVKQMCAPNVTRPIVNGIPLVSDPPIADVIGGSSDDWLPAGSTIDDQERSPHPLGLLSAIALGVDENTKTSSANTGALKRAYILGEDASPSIIEGVRRAAIGAHKRISSVFSSDPEKLKEKIGNILVDGLNAKIKAMKSNGIVTSTWSNLIPALSVPEVKKAADIALARILAGIDGNFKSLEEAKDFCSGVISREESREDVKLVLSEVPSKKWASRPAADVIPGTFLSYLAQVVLGLPILLVSKFQAMSMVEALAPFPAFDASRSIDVAGNGIPASDVLKMLIQTPGRNTSTLDSVVNLLSHSTTYTMNLMISCHDLVSKADKKKALSLSDKRNPEEEKAIEKSIKETTSDLLAKRSAIVNSIRQSALNFSTGYSKELAKVSPDQKVLNGLQVTDIKRLLALYSRDPAEVYSLALSAILLSLKNNNRSQADVKAMCDMIVKADGKLYDGEDLESFATVVAGSVPPNFNRVLPAQVSSDYIGSTRIYSKDLASEEGGDPIPLLGTGLDVIQVDAPSSSGSWFLHRASHIALAKSLMSDHIVSTFDENEKKTKEEIENNFAADDTSGLNQLAKYDINKKVQELEATGIFGQRGLELEPQTDEIEQLKGENEEEKRQIILVRNVNNFIKKQTKSSVIKALSDAGFDDTYYDALMTCVARRLGGTFNEALTRNVVTRYSSKKEMSQSLSVGGEVVVESEEGPEETGGFAGGRSEDAERERILKKGDMENFVYKWIHYPSYKTDGSIGVQSLPGFLARAMYKAELASQGDEAAKRFIENMTSSTEKLSYKKLLKQPLMMVLKNSVRLAVGHELFEVPARKNLAELLSYNQAAGSDIVSYKDVARDIGLFTDPLYASDKLAAGDSRGDSYELFFSRMIMKAGHMKVTDYSLWKAGMQEELEIYRKQNSARLGSMLARGIISKRQMDLIVQIMDRKYDGKTAFGSSYLSQEEASFLRQVGIANTRPSQSSQAYETASLPVFKSKLTDHFNETSKQIKGKGGKVISQQTVVSRLVDNAIKAIQSKTIYEAAFEKEASEYAAAGKDLTEELKAEALLKSYIALNSADNKEYEKVLRSRTGSDSFVLALARTDAFFDKLSESRGGLNKTAVEKLDALLSNRPALADAAARSRIVVAAFRNAFAEVSGPDFDYSLKDKDGQPVDISRIPLFTEAADALADAVVGALDELSGDRTAGSRQALRAAKTAEIASELENVISAQSVASFYDGMTLRAAVAAVAEKSPQLKIFMDVALTGKSGMVLRLKADLDKTISELNDISKLFDANSGEIMAAARSARGSDSEEGLARNVARYNLLGGDAKSAIVRIADQLRSAASVSKDIEKEEKTFKITGSAAHSKMLQIEEALIHARLPSNYALSTYKRTYQMHAEHVAELQAEYKKMVESNYSDVMAVNEAIVAKGKTLESATDLEIEEAVRQSLSKADPRIEATKREIASSPEKFLMESIGNRNVIGLIGREIKAPSQFTGSQSMESLWSTALTDLQNLPSVISAIAAGRPGYPNLFKRINSVAKLTPDQKNTLAKRLSDAINDEIFRVVKDSATRLAARVHDLPEEAEEEVEEIDPITLGIRVQFAKTSGVRIVKALSFAEEKVAMTAALAAQAAAGRDAVSPEFRAEFERAQKEREAAYKIDPATLIMSAVEDLTVEVEEDIVETADELAEKRTIRTQILNSCKSVVDRAAPDRKKIFQDFVTAFSAQINSDEVLENIDDAGMIALNTNYVARLKQVSQSAKSKKDAADQLVELVSDINTKIFKNKFAMSFDPGEEDSRIEKMLDSELAKIFSQLDQVLLGTKGKSSTGQSAVELGLENIRMALNSIAKGRRQVDDSRFDSASVMSVFNEIRSFVSADKADNATPDVMTALMRKLVSFGVLSVLPGVSYHKIKIPLTMVDDRVFENALRSLETYVNGLVELAKSHEEYAPAADAMVAFVDSYKEGARELTSEVDIKGAAKVIDSVLDLLGSSSEFDTEYLENARTELAEKGVLSRLPASSKFEEIHEEAVVMPASQPSVAPSAIDAQEGRLSPEETSLVVVDDSDFQRELDLLDKSADAIAYLAKSRPEYAESAKELTSFVESYQDGARKVANDADIGRAVQILESVSVFIRSSTGFGKAYLDGIRNELKNAGVLPNEPVAVEEPELDLEPEAMLEIDEGVLAPAEIPEEWLEEEEKGVVEISEMDIEPIDEEFQEISDEEFQEISDEGFQEISDEEFQEISDEGFQEISDEELQEIPQSAGSTGPQISQENAVVVNRIMEEIDEATDAVEKSSAMRGQLAEVRNSLTAAKATGAVPDDLSSLANVLDNATMLVDAIRDKNPDAPSRMAALQAAVQSLLARKHASRHRPTFIKAGDAWTVLM